MRPKVFILQPVHRDIVVVVAAAAAIDQAERHHHQSCFSFFVLQVEEVGGWVLSFAVVGHPIVPR